MSYRKKHYPAKPEKKEKEPDSPLSDVEYGKPGTERTLFTGRLTSGLPYQRPVDEREVNRLIREWDDRLLDPPVVRFRDGKFNVVDGQHRVAAMRKMNGGKEVMVPCTIYSGLTYEQEADLCYKLDKAKKRLTLAQATNALAESGTDADIRTVKSLIEANGFVWALNRRTRSTNEIGSIRALMKSWRALGNDEFSRMLVLLRCTWGGNPDSLTSFIFSGMTIFLKAYGAEIDDRLFIRQLSKVEPDEIVRRGKLDFSTTNNGLRYARVILEKYNNQRKNAKKLPYRFAD